MQNKNSLSSVLKSIIPRYSEILLKFFLIRFICIIPLSFFFLSCNDSSVRHETLNPGRRDYTWKIDTLLMPFNSFNDISGSSPEDVWACSIPGDLDMIFFHFDGVLWDTDRIVRLFSPRSISSLKPTTVWSGGLESIWKYDGLEWSKNFEPEIDSADHIVFEKIIALAHDDVWAVGQYFIGDNYFGLIYHFNGTSWSRLNISKIRTAFIDIYLVSNKIYLIGISNESFAESRYQFYELTGTDLREIFSGSLDTDQEYGSLMRLGDEIRFIIGYDLYSYSNGSLRKTVRLINDRNFLHKGWGRNDKDIFLGMADGIAHYNGENTVYLYQTPNKTFYRHGLIFEDYVFFIGQDLFGNNIILMGKIPE